MSLRPLWIVWWWLSFMFSDWWFDAGPLGKMIIIWCFDNDDLGPLTRMAVGAAGYRSCTQFLTRNVLPLGSVSRHHISPVLFLLQTSWTSWQVAASTWLPTCRLSPCSSTSQDSTCQVETSPYHYLHYNAPHQHDTKKNNGNANIIKNTLNLTFHGKPASS